MGRKVKPPRLERMYGDNFYIIDRRKQITTKTADPTVAVGLLSDYVIKKASEKKAQISNSVFTIAQILQFYLDEHVNSGKVVDRERIMKAVRAMERIYIDDRCFTMYTLAELSRRILREYEMKREAGAGTIRYELTVLRSALNHSVKEQRITRNDVPFIELPKAPENKKRWLTIEEAKVLIGSCNGRTRLFIYLALGSCGRKEAIENLKWAQVDFRNRFINLNPEGREQTDKHRASMRFGDYMWELLSHEKSIATTDFVLGSNADIRPSFNAATDRAGIPDVTPHVLRHTAATWTAQDGCSAYEIAGALGDTVQTVLDNYMHFSPTHLARPSDTLNARFVELREQRQL